MVDFNEVYKIYEELTNEYFKGKGKEEIKKKSQYFTPIEEADKLIDDINIIEEETITILDPSCGNGILLFKLIEKISFNNNKLKTFIIDVYDIDIRLLNNVKHIMEVIKLNNVNFVIEYFNEDFLISKSNKKYDYIIMNPPYKKINIKDAPEKFKKFLYGQPNLYHLFIAKTLSMLNNNGTICIMSPKNYLSGKYTEKLRKYIIDNFSITKIHTFNDRNKYFSNSITQEVCIVHIMKSKRNDIVLSYNDEDKFIVDKEKIILDETSKIICTPRNTNDYCLLNKFNKFEKGTIGKDILMKVGKVVQFRVKEKELNLSKIKFMELKKGVPLIVYRHISGSILNYRALDDKPKNNSVTLVDNKLNSSLFIKNSNYVLIRKNIDKKYDKLIHSVSYFKELNSTKLAIDNGIAYLTNKDDSLSEEEILGLQCILKSKQFDDYYRMVNSSHTINVYELENMHFPDLETIRKIGKSIDFNPISTEKASEIMETYF